MLERPRSPYRPRLRRLSFGVGVGALVGVLVAALVISGCSSKAEGDIACDGGVCEPKAIS